MNAHITPFSMWILGYQPTKMDFYGEKNDEGATNSIFLVEYQNRFVRTSKMIQKITIHK